MAEEKEIIEEGVELTGLDKLQKLYEENGSMVNWIVIAIVLIISAILLYLNVWKPRQEVAAQEDIFIAQHYFAQDSFALALNGSTFSGFLDVIDNHGSTKAGNLAHYYAGICYYNLGDYANAVEQLDDFSTDDEIIGALSYSAMADAQMELGQVDAALKNYSKAAEFSDNEASAPVMLLKTGMAYENQGKNTEAKKYYSEIITGFPLSNQAADAKLFLSRVEAAL